MPSDWPAISAARVGAQLVAGDRDVARRRPAPLLSVSPTSAHLGPREDGAGDGLQSHRARRRGPIARSAARRPCMAAVEASIQPPVTSPAAEMRAFGGAAAGLVDARSRRASPTSTPTYSRPSPSVLARMPMQMIACEPVKTPAVLGGRHATPPSSRSTGDGAGVELDLPCPRSRNASCTTSATSRSSAGRICGRDESSVTRDAAGAGRTRRTRSPWRRRRPRAGARGSVVQAEHLARREDAVVVDLGEGRLPRARAGADQQVVVGDARAVPALGVDGQHAVGDDRARAVDDRGLDAVEPLAHAARLVRRHAAGVRDRRAAGRRAAGRARTRRRAPRRGRSRPSRGGLRAGSWTGCRR